MDGPPTRRHYSGITYEVVCTKLDNGPAARCHQMWLRSRHNFMRWKTDLADLAYRFQCTEELIEETIQELEAERIKELEEKRAAMRAGSAGTTGKAKAKGKGKASGVGGGSQSKKPVSRKVQAPLSSLERDKKKKLVSRAGAPAQSSPGSKRRTRLFSRSKMPVDVLVPHPKTVRVAYQKETRDVCVKSEERPVGELGGWTSTVRRSSRPRKMTAIAKELALADRNRPPSRRKPPPPPLHSPPTDREAANEPPTAPSPAVLVPPAPSASQNEALRRRGTGFGTFLRNLDLEHTTAFFADYGFRTKKDVQMLKGWSDETKKTMCEWILKDRVMTVKEMGMFYESIKSKDGH